MGRGRWNRLPFVHNSASAATDLDIISDLMPIPDAWMRLGVRFPAWYLLLVAVVGKLIGCHSLRDLKRFAIRHHSTLTEALDLELRRSPSDSSFRYFFQQVDVTALCAAIRDWTIAQIPGVLPREGSIGAAARAGAPRCVPGVKYIGERFASPSCYSYSLTSGNTASSSGSASA